MSGEACKNCGADVDDHYTEWEEGVPFVGSYHNAPNGRICSPHMVGEKVGEYLVILPIGAAKELEQMKLQNESLKNDVALLQKGQPIMRPDVREEKRLNDEIDRLNRLIELQRPVMEAILRLDKCTREFDGSSEYCQELDAAMWDAVDEYRKNVAEKRKCVATVSGIKCEAQADYGDLCAAHRYLDNT